MDISTNDAFEVNLLRILQGNNIRASKSINDDGEVVAELHQDDEYAIEVRPLMKNIDSTKDGEAIKCLSFTASVDGHNAGAVGFIDLPNDASSYIFKGFWDERCNITAFKVTSTVESAEALSKQELADLFESASKLGRIEVTMQVVYAYELVPRDTSWKRQEIRVNPRLPNDCKKPDLLPSLCTVEGRSLPQGKSATMRRVPAVWRTYPTVTLRYETPFMVKLRKSIRESQQHSLNEDLTMNATGTDSTLDLSEVEVVESAVVKNELPVVINLMEGRGLGTAEATKKRGAPAVKSQYNACNKKRVAVVVKDDE